MATQDLRGECSTPGSQLMRPFTFISRSVSRSFDSQESLRSLSAALIKQPRRLRQKPCYDWIFSSATNVHVAVDRVLFKDYAEFDSYALTVSNQRRVLVRGIGTVELKIRCKSGSRESRTIVLEDVLHIPEWLCNVFSYTYFTFEFDHCWNDAGVSFTKVENDKKRAWGYTETFCGLDRLVLARPRSGTSPMMEDRDREVYSINLAWPQSQRERWRRFVEEKTEVEARRNDTRNRRLSKRRPSHTAADSNCASDAKTDVTDPEKSAMSSLPVTLARHLQAVMNMDRNTSQVSLSQIPKAKPRCSMSTLRTKSLKATLSARDRKQTASEH